jgi:hypothetical protein
MPGRHEVFTQFEEIIDLAVKNHLQAFVLVGHRLGAALHVDDAQTPMAQADPVLLEETLTIGSPMAHSRGHTLQQFWTNRSSRLVGYATDAAHDMPGFSGANQGRQAVEAVRLAGRAAGLGSRPALRR